MTTALTLISFDGEVEWVEVTEAVEGWEILGDMGGSR